MDDLLLDILKENESKNETFFESSTMNVCHRTGIAPLDYMLGYLVNVHDNDGNIIDSYPALGITCGTNLMSIGKSSTAKTALMLYIAGNIVRKFKHGLIIHLDLEQAMTLSRARAMTKFTIDEMKHKYLLKQSDTSIEGIKKLLVKVWKEKRDNPNKYMYNTGLKNEYGEDIIMYEPTVVLLDSIPSMSVGLNPNVKDDMKKIEEITSQTDRMRLTGEIGRFYTDLLPYLKEVNIIFMSINHIKVNPQMGIVKSPAELLYLKQDEALSGGKTPQYLAHILIKSVAIGSEKFTLEDDGFDGFGIWLEIIKSRSNQAGQKVHLIYDKVRGIDPIRTCIAYAKDMGLVSGDKNHTCFINNPDKKFKMREVNEYFRENRGMIKIMYEHIIPSLEKSLSRVDEKDLQEIPELMEY